MVSKGLATVIRYRQDDDQRSSHYDELLSAETKANKSARGLHSKKDATPKRVNEVAGVSLHSYLYGLGEGDNLLYIILNHMVWNA
jgi:hypothetical protein